MSIDARFTILGSSSGFPQVARATAGHALEVGGRLSLFDCGGGVTSSFLQRGFDPLVVDSVFISHTHPDHCCELPLFIQLVYLAGRLKPFTVFVPEEFVDPFAKYLKAVYLFPEKLPFELEIVGYSGGWMYDREFRAEAISNRHLEGYRDLITEHNLPNRMQSHSFVITAGDTRLYYSADVRGTDDVLPHINGVDVAVVEVTHIERDRLLQNDVIGHLRQLVLTHLGQPDEVDSLNAEIQKRCLEKVSLAYDGLTLEL